jgi:hypothetical protein
MVLAWAQGSLPHHALDAWSAPGLEQLTLRFDQVQQGAVLEIEAQNAQQAGRP